MPFVESFNRLHNIFYKYATKEESLLNQECLSVSWESFNSLSIGPNAAAGQRLGYRSE